MKQIKLSDLKKGSMVMAILKPNDFHPQKRILVSQVIEVYGTYFRYGGVIPYGQDDLQQIYFDDHISFEDIESLYLLERGAQFELKNKN